MCVALCVFRVCGALPKGSTVTRVMAECGQLVQQVRLWGPAVSLALAARHLCAPAIAHLNPPADPAPYQPLQRLFSGDVIPKFDAQPTGLSSLLVFTVNAGGLATKLPMLLALLEDIELDIVGVQEGGPLFFDTSLQGIPYSVVLGPHVPGGGLAILVHARLKTRQAVQKDLMDNAISIALPVSDKVPVIISNVHFPPGMPALQRRLCMLQTSAFHARHPGGIKLVLGVMNADFADASGNWLRKACEDNRYWGGYTHMYPPGEPTNIVVSRTRTSRRELDWILVGPQSPVSACRKALLLGLGTHLVVACEFTVRSEYLAQANPAGRLFRFRLADQGTLAVAAVVASLAFWWAWCARLRSDGALAL